MPVPFSCIAPVYVCPTCETQQKVAEATYVLAWSMRKPVATGGKDGCATIEVGPVIVVRLACGHGFSIDTRCRDEQTQIPR